MKWGRRILVVLLASGVVATLGVVVWPREKEPEYEGKRLSEWLKVMSSATDNPSTGTKEWSHAEWAVQHMESNAVSFLVRWIGYERPGWSRNAWVQTIFTKFPRLERSCTRRWDERERLAFMSMACLRSLGPCARDAMPGLVRLARAGCSKQRTRAMTTLEQFGQDGLERLMEILNDDLAPARFEAAGHVLGLGRAGVDIGSAVPVILRRSAEIRSSPQVNPDFPPGADYSDRPFYVQQVFFMQQLPPGFLPAVVDCMRHTNGAVRLEAINLVTDWACWESDPVVSALGGALKDPDLEVRQAATNVLKTVADDVNGAQRHKASAMLGRADES
jgi:hypothetical protein